ncbi:MAG: hypothetical protein C4535_20300 [Comamonadaceae bacterium]|nr:MAG: hypothetical protein C4535_20300 [Comamonadaceae bacterium]
MTYCVPEPLEDELAAGIAGRLARLNGLPSIAIAIDCISRAGRHLVTEKTPKLWRLAELLGEERFDFANRHSMLPALFPVSRYLDTANEQSCARSVAMLRGMQIPHKVLRWCQACVQRDLDTRGFGIWRRKHQLAGVDVCLEHGLALVTAATHDAYRPPGHASTVCSPYPCSSELQRECSVDSIARFQSLMSLWLTRRTPLRVAAWASAVGARCRDVNVRVGNLGSLPTVSDLLRDQMPISWLHRHMPDVANKRPRDFIGRVDGACYAQRVPYPSLICTAILAVLFSSAEEASEALDSADRQLSGDGPLKVATQLALKDFARGSGLVEAGQRHGVCPLVLEAVLREKLLKKHAKFKCIPPPAEATPMHVQA